MDDDSGNHPQTNAYGTDEQCHTLDAATRASTLKAKPIHIFYISNLLLISNQCYVVISLMLWR